MNKSIETLLELFDSYGELILVTSKVDICRDQKDNFLLSLAKDGIADFLVTGDQDLLILNQLETTKIITYQKLLEIIKE